MQSTDMKKSVRKSARSADHVFGHVDNNLIRPLFKMDPKRGLATSIRGAVAVGILKAYRTSLRTIADLAEHASLQALDAYGDQDAIMVVYAEIARSNMEICQALDPCGKAAEARMFSEIHEAAEYISGLTSSFANSDQMNNFAKKMSEAALKHTRSVADGFAAVAHQSGLNALKKTGKEPQHHGDLVEQGSRGDGQTIYRTIRRKALRLAFFLKYRCGLQFF